MCPEFDESDYEKILDWAKAKVIYDEGWYLSWEHGVISLYTEESKACMAAALFIYLWCKGVECGIASNCALSYVRYVL